MKRILKAVAFSLMLVSGSLLQNTASAQYYDDDRYDQDREVSYQTFYDELSPYGRWVDYPNYGYVWVPDAGPDFRPYSSRGHWVWTDNYEWMWVSDYEWGWAPFHYGRWDYDSYIGWYWVPGYEWSPAWVAWRDGGDYYGWAPIRPGISISINFNIGRYSPPFDFWCFAPRRYITSPRIYDYYVDRRQNVTIINQTTIIINNYHYGNNYGFRSGPRRYDAERYCGRINPVRFRESYRPGRTEFRNNEVTIYRPEVRREDNRRFAPRSFERYDRNSNGGFRNNDNRQTNDQPDRRRFDRNNDQVNQQQNNGNNNNFPERRRFDRRDDQVNQQQNNNVPDRRRFDRREEPVNQQPNNNGGNNFPERQRFDRREEPVNQQPNNNGNNTVPERRRFERNENNSSNTPVRQPETRRNDNNLPQRQPQVERQQQQPQPQPSQQQPRRFERRNEDNQQQKNDNGNGNGNGRGKGNGRNRF